VQDIQRRVAAPCCNVSESTDKLGCATHVRRRGFCDSLDSNVVRVIAAEHVLDTLIERFVWLPHRPNIYGQQRRR
jgi:hypothetical protein